MVPEVGEFIKDVVKVPGRLFELVRFNVQESVEKYLNCLMEAELTFFLGRGKRERPEVLGLDYRNGSYSRRFTIKGIGQAVVRIPRDRDGEFKTGVIPRSRQYEDRIQEDLSLLFLSGVSARTLSLLTRRLVGRSLSHEEVSKANRALTDGIEKWRNRDLSQGLIKYLFVDGVIFRMRIGFRPQK
ncbi:MAG: transposase [Nitrospinae bacterium]|nr:transposase [Nitrospinota bacterium]